MKDNIILIAATNRPDILDPALLRPGRFDRQISVDRPDRNGRRKILEVHSKGKPLASVIDLDSLAAGTPGFTGADLRNLINEAALLAARRGKKVIEQDELEEGIMRVIAGPEKKARLLSEKEQRITAYHEMGHALVGHFLENTDPIHKITIVSRGPGARPDDLAPGRGSLPDDAQGAARADRDDDGRPRRGGDRLQRDHDGRLERHREGDADREGDGHALRDEREARPARPRPQPRHAVPRARDGRRSPTTPMRSPARSTTRSAASSKRATTLATRVLREHIDDLHRISQILIERETIDKDQFVALLAGESEDSVFPPPEPEPEPERKPEPKRAPVLKPRPFPLPGGAAMQPPEPEAS